MSEMGTDDITIVMRAGGSIQGMGVPFAPGYAAPKDGYEFTGEENETILKLSGAMAATGTVQAVFGGLLIVAGLIGMLAGWGLSAWLAMGAGLVLLVTGIWVRQAASSLEIVTQSRGNGILNLMDGFERVTGIFNLQRAWYALGILFSVAMIGGTLWLWMQQKPG